MVREWYRPLILAFLLFWPLLSYADDGLPPGIDKSDYYKVRRTTALASDSIVDPPIAWPLTYGVQQTGKINASFDCFGTFGLGSPVIEGWPSSKFNTPDGSAVEYLWSGTIMIGGIVGEDTLVSMGFGLQYYEGREFLPPGYGPNSHQGSVRSFRSISDFAMRAVFTDTIHDGITRSYDQQAERFHVPLNVRCVNRSHVWRVDSLANTIIYDLIITNIGRDTILQGYVGFFFDTDVTGGGNLWPQYLDDLAGSLRQQGIGYAVDNNGEPDMTGQFIDTSPTKAFAFKFLATSFEQQDTNFNWWIRDYDMTTTDFGPRMRGTADDPYREFATGQPGPPLGDYDCFYLLSHREWDYDQALTGIIQPYDPVWMWPDPDMTLSPAAISHGDDIRFMMSTGPFDLFPDSSIRLLYATFSGDSIINRTDLLIILDAVPGLFSSALNFDNLIYTAAASDSLAARLIDPACPVSGLEATRIDSNSIALTWDPWVFPGVDGYEIYLWEISPESLFFPSLPPPWLQPSQLEHHASVGAVTEFVLDDLDPGKAYLVNVANQSDGVVGDPGEPVVVRSRDRPPAPAVPREFAFSVDDNPAVVSWSAPPGIEVHHYNLYRFADSSGFRRMYHPFFDDGIERDKITPADSFYVHNRWYYYYAMEPYTQLDGGTTHFFEHAPSNGIVYVISAVDDRGLESEFSPGIRLEVVPPRTRDILVLSYSQSGGNFVTFETVKDFYDSVLAGYDYDIMNFEDSLPAFMCSNGQEDCLGWKRLHQYELVIVDDGLQDRVIAKLHEDRSAGFTRYLLSGGKLAYFGAFTGLDGFTGMTSPGYYLPKHAIIERFFAVDSVFYVGVAYYRRAYGEPPFVDTLFGLGQAKPATPEFPELVYDSLRYPFTTSLLNYWPPNTPPSVATFLPREDAVVTHRYGSIYPGTSMNEGQPVGLRTPFNTTVTWLFGFHLWYMDYSGARALIELFGVVPDQAGCCLNASGNVDASKDKRVDIGDVQHLIAYLFNNESLNCIEAANIDGDPQGIVSITDLLLLIDHLFVTFPTTAPCPGLR